MLHLETSDKNELIFNIAPPPASDGTDGKRLHGPEIRYSNSIETSRNGSLVLGVVKRAERERRAISKIVHGILTTPNLGEFLKLVHHSLEQVVYAENCYVMLHDPVQDTMHFEFWLDQYGAPPPLLVRGRGFTSYVLRTGKPVLLTQDMRKRLVDTGEVEQLGSPAASWIGIPLHTHPRTIGVLAVCHYYDEHAYSNRDLEFLSSVGEQIGLAVERKRAEDALEESEASFKSLFETASDGILVLNDGKFLACNPMAERLFGCKREDILGSSPSTFAPEIQPDGRLSSEMMDAYMKAALVDGPQFFKWKSRRLDGTVFDSEVSLNRVDFRGATRIRQTVRDITERTELEDQLRQSQKMEAVGVLAGGIAHDFNNLLTAINGYSDLTLKNMSAEDALRHNIEEIKNTSRRAAELTAQLLAFSRKQVLKPVILNPNTAISNVEKMLRPIIRQSVDLRVILDPELKNIRADAGQIERVIVNLAINARDAMREGGTLTIETQNIYLDEDYASQHAGISPGAFVELTVTDTGEGMSEETLQRIFEPFFTTKEVGKGTGLGLATVYGIVKQSGGHVMVNSELDRGTSFKIYLPAVDQTILHAKCEVELQEEYRGTGTILLVEDEEIVRNLVCNILSSNGYHILVASNGREALSLTAKYPGTIDLLLTDVIMPKMGGNELRDHIIQIRPNIRVLLMSGYTEDSVSQRGIDNGEIAFIEKPFTPDELAKKVHAALEQ